MSVFRPTETVDLGDRQVTVKQLAFLDAIEFGKRLARTAGQMVDPSGRVKIFGTGPDGKRVIIPEEVAELIGSSQSLAGWLIEKSAKIPATEILELSATEGLAILHAALRVNLTERLAKEGNGLAAFLGKQFLRKAANTSNGATSPLPLSSTGSSPTDTAPGMS